MSPRTHPLRNFMSVLAGVLMLAALVGLIWASRSMNPEWLEEWKANVHPLHFFAVMTLAQIVGMPGTPFYLMAPLAYGIPLSLVGTLLSLSVTLILAYAVVRGGLGPLVQRILDRSGYQLPDLNGGRGLRFTLLLRFLPALPAAVKNYMLAIAGVPFPTYFVLSLVISFLYAAPLIILGESVFERDWSLLIGAAAVLLAVGLFTRWLRRRMKS